MAWSNNQIGIPVQLRDHNYVQQLPFDGIRPQQAEVEIPREAYEEQQIPAEAGLYNF